MEFKTDTNSTKPSIIDPDQKLNDLISNKLKLNSQEFKDFLRERLAPFLNHPIVSQQRIFIPEHPHNYNDYEDYDFPDDFDIDEENEIPTLKAPRKDPTKLIKCNRTCIGKDLTSQGIKNKTISFLEGTFTPINFEYGDYKKKEYDQYFQNKLGKVHNFYHDGILAGGAIAALANEFLFGVPAVINDVDYFYFSHFGFGDIESLDEHLYEHLAEDDRAYEIVSSRKDGLLNLIKITASDYRFSWDHLIKSFDINCCMIFVHPITMEVTLSSSFSDFIYDRQIRHKKDGEFNFSNIIRAKRKSKELEAKYYFNDSIRDLIIKDLTRSSSIGEWGLLKFIVENKSIPLIKNNKWSPRFVAEKDRKALKDDPLFLAPFFQYRTDNSLTYKPSIPVLDFFIQYYNGSLLKGKNDRTTNFFVIKEIMKKFNPKYPDQDVSPKYYERLLLFIEAFKEYGLSLPYEHDTDKIELLAKLIANPICSDKFRSLLIKIKGHRDLLTAMMKLLNLGWNFTNCDIFLRKVVNLGLKEIGLFELLMNQFRGEITKCSYPVGNISFFIDLEVITPDEFISVIKDIKTQTDVENTKFNTLREKVSLGRFNQYVTELTLSNELEEEGKRMKHCVGGYSDSVRKQKSRIFHLQIGELSSTLQVNINYKESYSNKKIDKKTKKKIRKNKTFHAAGIRLSGYNELDCPIALEKAIEYRQNNLMRAQRSETPIGPYYSYVQNKSSLNRTPDQKLKNLAHLLICYLNTNQTHLINRPIYLKTIKKTNTKKQNN